jgi:hypothetical protein
MSVVMGIDPGKKGGIVIVGLDVLYSTEMPLSNKGKDINTTKILSLLREWKELIEVIHIEKQQAMSSQGVTSTFTTGHNYGLLVGAALGVGIPIVELGAKQWQKPYLKEPILTELVSIPTSKMKESKKRSISACNRLFPSLELRTPKGRWKDGIADALLIASYKP